MVYEALHGSWSPGAAAGDAGTARFRSGTIRGRGGAQEETESPTTSRQSEPPGQLMNQTSAPRLSHLRETTAS